MHKNIKWANKELPGLSHEDLVKLNSSKIGQIEGGKTTGNSLNGQKQIREIQKIGSSLGGKTGASGKSQIESGKIQDFIEGGQRNRDEYWANISKEQKEIHISKLHEGLKRYSDTQRAKHLQLFNDLPNEFNRDNLKQVSKLHGFNAGVQIIIRYYQDIWFNKIAHGKYKKIWNQEN